jgi:hypothetical protein
MAEAADSVLEVRWRMQGKKCYGERRAWQNTVQNILEKGIFHKLKLPLLKKTLRIKKTLRMNIGK